MPLKSKYAGVNLQIVGDWTEEHGMNQFVIEWSEVGHVCTVLVLDGEYDGCVEYILENCTKEEIEAVINNSADDYAARVALDKIKKERLP